MRKVAARSLPTVKPMAAMRLKSLCVGPGSSEFTAAMQAPSTSGKTRSMQLEETLAKRRALALMNAAFR